MRRLDRTDVYPIYAFRQPGRPGWSLVACHPDDRSPEASARELFPDLFDWHLSELAFNALIQMKAKVESVGRECKNTFSGHRDPSWAWDDVEQCWRAPEETITPPPHVETVERLGVAFAQPGYGWIDLTLSTPTQSVLWPLSDVYDPFRSELTSWMEAVVERSQPRLFVYVEHMHARLDVIPAESGMVILVAYSVAVRPEEAPLAVKMPRSAFVRDFYSALVSFWEGEELRKNWNSWLCGVEDWAPGRGRNGLLGDRALADPLGEGRTLSCGVRRATTIASDQDLKGNRHLQDDDVSIGTGVARRTRRAPGEVFRFW